MVLIVIQCYWIIASLGFLDLEFLDFDFDLELEGADGGGLFHAIGLIINFGQVPFSLVLSLISLNFWITMMLTYYLPIEAGGLVAGILLLPALILSVFITKIEVLPLKDRFFEKTSSSLIENKVLDKRCLLKSDLEYGKLGQGEIKQDGASIVINVRAQFENESFKKDEYAFVLEKMKRKMCTIFLS